MPVELEKAIYNLVQLPINEKKRSNSYISTIACSAITGIGGIIGIYGFLHLSHVYMLAIWSIGLETGALGTLTSLVIAKYYGHKIKINKESTSNNQEIFKVLVVEAENLANEELISKAITNLTNEQFTEFTKFLDSKYLKDPNCQNIFKITSTHSEKILQNLVSMPVNVISRIFDVMSKEDRDTFFTLLLGKMLTPQGEQELKGHIEKISATLYNVENGSKALKNGTESSLRFAERNNNTVMFAKTPPSFLHTLEKIHLTNLANFTDAEFKKFILHLNSKKHLKDFNYEYIFKIISTHPKKILQNLVSMPVNVISRIFDVMSKEDRDTFFTLLFKKMLLPQSKQELKGQISQIKAALYNSKEGSSPQFKNGIEASLKVAEENNKLQNTKESELSFLKTFESIIAPGEKNS